MLKFNLSSVLKFVAALMMAFIMALVILGSTGTSYIGVRSVRPANAISPAQVAVTNNYNQIYQQVSPSVVAINVTLAGRNGRTVGAGTGSGFVIDTNGHIVTNDHVVGEANSIEVEFFDGTLASAKVVGLDPASDLAVIQVDVAAEHLIPVKFGDSDALLIGQPVLAIGSPYGEDWTLTTGIVSGLNRVISGLTNFSIGGVIQTDAAINPGNSGGPLLDMNGQIIGVNSQIMSESGSNSGVGFAIPINLVQRVAQQLIEKGKAVYSYMGISGTDVTLSAIQKLGLPANTRGVLITETVNGGPAAQAGLHSVAVSDQTGNISPDSSFDVVTAVGGNPIKGMNDLIAYLARKTQPGDKVTLTILRDGKQTINVDVTVTARP